MNNKWGNDEAKASAQDLVAALSLKKAGLQAVSDWTTDKEPTEILGDIFNVLRTEYPQEYWIAFRSNRVRKTACKDCGGPKGTKGGRGYCSSCYGKHRRAGDF